MAAMDQTKLDNMCNSISSLAGEYQESMIAEKDKVQENFNTYWVSKASKELAKEISDCLTDLVTKIDERFSAKNEDIRAAVNNFNLVEQEDINYKGFSMGTPNVEMSLNNALPNGKVGVAENAEIADIKLSDLETAVCGILDNIKSTVQSADAFDNAEQEALSQGVESLKKLFTDAMIELTKSLETRMNGEIALREKLATANIGGLGQ